MRFTSEELPFYAEFDDVSIQKVSAFLEQQHDATIYVPYRRQQTFFDMPYQPLSKLIELAKGFSVFTYDPELGERILKLVPFSKSLALDPERVSVFVTCDKQYYQAHKDGADLRVGVNYPLYIKDELCETRWYSDADGDAYARASNEGTSRDANGFDPRQHSPEKVFTMKPDRGVILNVDRYHDFENFSTNRRAILTLRPRSGALSFEAALDRLKKMQNLKLPPNLRPRQN